MDERSDLEIVSEACCDTNPSVPVSEMHEQLADLLRKYNPNDYAARVKVFAIKPSENRHADLDGGPGERSARQVANSAPHTTSPKEVKL